MSMPVLVFAWVVCGMMFHQIGSTPSRIKPPCKNIETACVQPKFSSFVQMSLTFTGLLVTRSGGNLVGAKNSFSRCPKPPKLAPHCTASRLFPDLLAMRGVRLKQFHCICHSL